MRATLIIRYADYWRVHETWLKRANSLEEERLSAVNFWGLKIK